MGHVGHIALQHAEGMVVGRCIHRLRQVDDHRPVRAKQHVELRQVAVHQPGTQHQHDLANDEGMVRPGFLGFEVYVVQARGRVTVGIGHQLHQQHAVLKIVGPGNPHASAGQAEQRRHFGVLPGVFGFLAAVLAALGHGPGLTAVANLAALLVLGSLAETALVGFFINLGAAHLAATAHHIHGGFLATHQRPQYFVDQAVFDQGFDSFGCLHQAAFGVLAVMADILSQPDATCSSVFRPGDSSALPYAANHHLARPAPCDQKARTHH